MLNFTEHQSAGGSTTYTADVSGTGLGPRVKGGPPTPYLFVALDCERIHDGSSRYALDGVRVVRIGRGHRREVIRSLHGAELTLTLPDRRASREHACLQFRDGHWTIEDLGAKNGTFVNGRLVDGVTKLEPGAVLEVGHTFLIVRPSTTATLAEPTPARTARRTDPVLATVHPELAHVLNDLAATARTPANVTILGETGSGKDVVANAYHRLTGRAGPLVAVNSGAIPSALIESELFGHKRGAYSGAMNDNLGHVRAADGGTLFLDEIGDLQLSAQAALLRVIETREVTPVGCSRPVRVDVRIVCATHRDIPAMVACGEFRPDLWARLAGAVMRLPPLRERLVDMGQLLSAAVLRHAGDERGRRIRFTPAAGRALMLHTWPLNVRELMNEVAHALAIASDDTISTDHLEFQAMPVPAAPPALDHVAPALERVPLAPVARLAERRAARKEELERLLALHRGNVTNVAFAMGKSRPLVYKLLEQLGIDANQFRQ